MEGDQSNDSNQVSRFAILFIRSQMQHKISQELSPHPLTYHRSSVQVKSHAQQMMQKSDEGINVFQKLEDFNSKKSTKIDDVISGSPFANSRKDVDAALSLVMMASK
jgi:hypothetical protein